jgi:hypothetical protein
VAADRRADRYRVIVGDGCHRKAGHLNRRSGCKAPRYLSTIKEQLGMLNELGRILEQRSVPGTWVDD